MKTDIQLSAEANKIREKFGYSNKEPVDIQGIILSQKDYTMIRVPLSQNISGMCALDNGSKVIAINTDMSLGRQRFTAAHEIYHIEVEKCANGKICRKELYEEKSESETEADKFASYFLMPYDGLEWYISDRNITEWTEENVLALSQYYNISFFATIVRLMLDGRISKHQKEVLAKKDIAEIATNMGVGLELYSKSPEEQSYRVYGEYNRRLENMHRKHSLTDGLYMQFCREAFLDESTISQMKGEVVYD